jgi:hypothetical protein
MTLLLGHRPSLWITHKENRPLPTTRAQCGLVGIRKVYMHNIIKNILVSALHPCEAGVVVSRLSLAYNKRDTKKARTKAQLQELLKSILSISRDLNVMLSLSVRFNLTKTE